MVITSQIAEALEHAHEKNIIHRDLKPANVKVTPEGKVKVLDFGLAKAFEAEPDSSDPGDSPTLMSSPTLPGVILGAAAYMSPEQAKGKRVDRRTDIWALGCVLYELLTAKPVFTGESVTEILGAIHHKEPDWDALPANTPPGIRALLRRCLTKDSNRRLRSAADIAVTLEDTLTASATTQLQPVSRLTISLPPGQHLAALDQPAIAISPDGKNIVYVAVRSRDREGAGANQGQSPSQELCLRPLDSLEAKPIAGTEGAVAPFFSPDGQWIGFFAGGKLKKVSVNEGAAVTLATAPIPGGASWSSQGTLALQGNTSGEGLQQVSQEGGMPQPLTRLGKGENLHRWPEFLPGGQAVLFAGSVTFNSWSTAQIAVQHMQRGERKNLVQGTQPRYAPTGHLLYAQSGTLMAVPFDARRLSLTAGPVPAIEDVMQSAPTGAAQYSVSSTGTLVYLAGGVTGSENQLVWVSRNGEEQPLPAVPHNYTVRRVSPDGRRIAVAVAEQETQVWVYDVSRDTLTRVTFEGKLNTALAWSPDGRRIAFRSNRAGPTNLFWQVADGSGVMERLTTSEHSEAPNSFSPDGRLLAFTESTPETSADIWVLSLKDGKAQPFLRTPYEETAPKFSPDGKWLAYSSDESGRREVYVQPYPGPGGKWQISTDGGQEPVWNPKGGSCFTAAGARSWRWTWTPSPAFRRVNPGCSSKARTC